MAEGWIKLYRSIRKNWIWEDPQKLKWWLDILLQANHQEKKILLGTELTVIEKGSFHTSLIKLSERWKVDKKTVKRFLILLQNDNMISLETSKKGTTVKISNYNVYQSIQEGKKDHKEDYNVPIYAPTDGTIKSPSMPPISPHKVDTNKNEEECNKNYKNEEEGKEGEELYVRSTPLLFPSDSHRKLYDAKCISELVYKAWFMNATITEDEGKITISVRNSFSADTIRNKYLKDIKKVYGGKEIVVK